VSDDNFLRVADVSKWYGEEQVLRDVSFEMDRGDVTVLIGPSGSGKSTMLRCVNRLAEAQEGSILLDGEEDSHRISTSTISAARSGWCSRVQPVRAPHRGRQRRARPARRVLGLSETEARDRAEAQLERVGLGEQLDSYPRSCPGANSSASASPARWPWSRS